MWLTYYTCNELTFDNSWYWRISSKPIHLEIPLYIYHKLTCITISKTKWECSITRIRQHDGIKGKVVPRPSQLSLSPGGMTQGASPLVGRVLAYVCGHFSEWPPSSPPRLVYTEQLPGDSSLALIIRSLRESEAGNYTCSATFANSEQLSRTVRIETIGETRLIIRIINARESIITSIFYCFIAIVFPIANHALYCNNWFASVSV